MKTHLVETTQIKPEDYKKKDSLTESEQTITISEGTEQKKEYHAKAVYSFPISRPNQENLNGRVYNNKLWENTITRLKEISTFGLMDHPQNEGSTKDIWCVWRNLRFSESKETIVADAYLIGDYGKQILEILEAGGNIGLSTSGFGEFLEDKKTIDPESFELERVADFVFNPSYEVFGTQADKVTNESVDLKQESVEKDKKIKTIEIEESTKVKTTKQEDFITKSFRLNIASSFKNARQLEDVQERLDTYTELLTYFDEGIAEDLREEISKALILETEEFKNKAVNENKALFESLTQKVTDLTSENNSLTENYKNATELLDSLKVYSSKLKEMYELVNAERNGMVTAGEYRESQVYITSMEEEFEKAKKELVDLKKELSESKISINKQRVRESQKEPILEDKIKVEKVEKVEEDYSNVSADIIAYYNDLEYAIPSVIKIKEDILSCKTIMEAQKKYLRLKPLLSDTTSAYDRKSKMVKNTYVESTKQRLPRKEGWV